MAEVLEKKESAAPTFADAPVLQTASKKKKRAKKIRKWIVTILVLLLIAAAVFFLVKKFGKQEGEQQLLTDILYRGAISSQVEGSNVVLAKDSASITLLSNGQVTSVFVSEGDYVTAGTPLYSIESSEAAAQVAKAQQTVEKREKELASLNEAANDLNIRVPYAGKLLNAERLNAGDTIVTGQRLATLVDDTKMLLSLYYSYAYENDIAVGQQAVISVPAAMSQLLGTVREIHKVRRISPEGSFLFEVVLELNNPGTLTAEMDATATLTAADGEQLYPYEAGKLNYFRTEELCAKLGGVVESSRLLNYAAVSSGESVVALTSDGNSKEIAEAESALKTAQDALAEAQKNLDSLNGIAPIDGTVLMLNVYEGMEATAGTVAANIADTRTLVINAQVDEMNISYIKPGMFVSVDQWGTFASGTVESVSLMSTYENGMATFPVVINVDNSEGMLMSGSYVTYSFTASQNDDCILAPIQSVKYVETEEGTRTVLFVRADSAPENAVVPLYETFDVPEGFYPVPVEIGISDNSSVEILSGAEEGTEVFTSTIMAEMW